MLKYISFSTNPNVWLKIWKFGNSTIRQFGNLVIRQLIALTTIFQDSLCLNLIYQSNAFLLFHFAFCIYSSLPVSHKQIGVISSTIITVTAEKDLFPIRRKHGESIKTFIAWHFLQPASIGIHSVHIKDKEKNLFHKPVADEIKVFTKHTSAVTRVFRACNCVRILRWFRWCIIV